KGHYTYPMVAQFSTGILAHFSISIYNTQDNQEKEKLFYKEELNKGTWYIITTAFTFIDDKLIKQEVVKEERTFQKCDCNK
ncbi:hypothetical protein AAAU73_18120, partial [Phocaeicola vulgatus]|uniref:hypothetical protein n=1 Tax=Phocaeicola vulgatus TaxID=821 RepID=UPI0032C07A55